MKKTTVQGIRDIYVALGGTGTEIPDNMEIPAALAKTAIVAAAVKSAADAKELPAVTAANDGAVLKVIEGKWAIGTDEIQA